MHFLEWTGLIATEVGVANMSMIAKVPEPNIWDEICKGNVNYLQSVVILIWVKNRFEI